jgi:hypothetical protein
MGFSSAVHPQAGTGIAPQDFEPGMMPSPGQPGRHGAQGRAAKIYWAVKHGIKMTGMPA